MVQNETISIDSDDETKHQENRRTQNIFINSKDKKMIQEDYDTRRTAG